MSKVSGTTECVKLKEFFKLLLVMLGFFIIGYVKYILLLQCVFVALLLKDIFNIKYSL